MTVQRSREAQGRAEARRKVSDAASDLRELGEHEVRSSVESAISELGTVAADFYGRLVLNSVYSSPC